jgi:CRP-like cAMP-binding protein
VESHRHLVRVFEHDPELLDGVDLASAAFLRRRAAAPSLTLEPGRWAPPLEAGAQQGILGLLVLDGLLIRCIRFDGRNCPELVGPGDLLRPWDETGDVGPLEHESSWRVLRHATLAVLDERFAAVAATRPAIFGNLLSRGVLRSRALAFHLAIAQVRRAESRLLMALWHIAGRWGRVGVDGITVPLPLTHELLAHLVCLRRPTASSALQRLIRAGELARCTDGGWLLRGDPPVDPALSQQRQLAA